MIAAADGNGIAVVVGGAISAFTRVCDALCDLALGEIKSRDTHHLARGTAVDGYRGASVRVEIVYRGRAAPPILRR